MKKIEFNCDEPMERNCEFDGETYAIQNGNIFKLEGDKYVYTEEVTAEQLEIYGEDFVEKPTIFEMKILEIKEKDNGMALITAEDGSGMKLTFVDKIYSSRNENYEIGKVGKYYLFANVSNAEVAEDYAKGICLTGKDADKWFEWTGDDAYVGIVDEAWTDLPEVTKYSEAEDFADTGKYNFYGFVNEPGFVSFDETPAYGEDGELISDGFKLCLPNQFDRVEPKYVMADFDTGKFPERIFKDLTEDKDTDFSEGGWVIKGTVFFSVYEGDDEWWQERFQEDEVTKKYGQNYGVSYEDKMSEYDDDED